VQQGRRADHLLAPLVGRQEALARPSQLGFVVGMDGQQRLSFDNAVAYFRLKDNPYSVINLIALPSSTAPQEH